MLTCSHAFSALCLINNYSPQAKWILWNDPRDEALVTIRANGFSFFFSPETSKISRWLFWKLVLNVIITSRGVIMARYDVILDQSERALLYNHLSNYTNTVYLYLHRFLTGWFFALFLFWLVRVITLVLVYETFENCSYTKAILSA